MKYFISQPMRGLTVKEILSVRAEVVKHIKAIDSKAEIIDSYIDNNGQDRPPLWYLGESIKKLGEADVVVFAEDYSYYAGCRIEHRCAKEYGKRIYIYEQPILSRSQYYLREERRWQ